MAHTIYSKAGTDAAIAASGGSGGGSTSWDAITGKPPVIGAGSTQAAARQAIGAGTSSLGLGSTATTAAKGDHDHDSRYVRTVNNVGPDAAGNVVVEGGGGGGPTLVRADAIYPLTGLDTTESLTPAVGKVHLTPVHVPASITLRRLVVKVRHAATEPTDVELGLYDSTGRLIMSAGTLDISTEGTKTVDSGATHTIPAGLIFTAARLRSPSANGGSIYRGHKAGIYTGVGNPWDDLSDIRRGISVDVAGTGALPASIAGLTLLMAGESVGMGYRVA